jgi:hypothetical protein
MDAYLNTATRDRRLACLKVMEQKRLQAASVDKDFWVCWTLRELFGLADIGERITFKGGTSLSKAWGLIERFSEDIDLVVHKEALGFGGDASPDRAPTSTSGNTISAHSGERPRLVEEVQCRSKVSGVDAQG